jgi:hypothetical protein
VGGGGVVGPFGAANGRGGVAVPVVPPGGGPRLALPDGLTLEPAGAPTLLDSFVFTYHVAGDPAPARVAPINLPRPAQKS